MTTINTNIGAINAQSNMARVNDEFNTAMTRLSTGLRVNAAKDDAAGMAIGEKMTAQVMGLNQAIRNASDGKNLVDTTEGAHVEVSNMLQRLRELAVQSANDTNTASDRGSLMAEAKQLIAEVDRVAETTTFNGMNILDGSFKGKQLQIGADAGTTMQIDVDSAKATDIGAHELTSEQSTTSFDAETVTISGHRGSETLTTTATDSAKDIAARINGISSSTGVSATAKTTAVLEGPEAAGSAVASTVQFDINGVSTKAVAVPAADPNGGERLESLRDAINDLSSQTGVTAEINDDGNIVLSDVDGDDIKIENFASSTASSTMTITSGDGAATFDLDPTTAGTTDTVNMKGSVNMTSTNTFSVATDVADVANTSESFLNTTAANLHFGSSLSAVSEVDITTAEGANDALKVIDVALSKISDSRADLGAVSNRLDSVISNLTNISTSVQAAKSQVMDADFAQESTNLARGQILSQAATAMLAQANSSKQGVLQLLRG
ncbi:flagellin N-terminal helical domain-containing protein [Marivivens aquimaris]|uniref:flagellin N-terminal helical domain-containing protein n=1 Tax=Marivivens aquimaris TaxID=2774876 RepID=UPI00187F507C|nr:flagellin [Marivivens aquimaris]